MDLFETADSFRENIHEQRKFQSRRPFCSLIFAHSNIQSAIIFQPSIETRNHLGLVSQRSINEWRGKIQTHAYAHSYRHITILNTQTNHAFAYCGLLLAVEVFRLFSFAFHNSFSSIQYESRDWYLQAII